jgi:predicted dehydrogenase
LSGHARFYGWHRLRPDSGQSEYAVALVVAVIVDRDKLGDVYQFESSFEHRAPDAGSRWQDRTPIEAGGGVTFDLGSHLIDQALTLFGPARDVQADVRTVRAGGGNDDVSFIRLIHESGTRSHLFMSRLGAQPGPRFRVLGTHGAFVSYGLDGQEPALAAGVKPDDPAYGIEPESTWGTLVSSSSGDPAPVKVPTMRGDYPGFYEQIARAVRGAGPLPVEPRDALEVVKIIMQVHARP